MIKIEIEQKKQSNGLWGTPLNCVSLKDMSIVSDYNMTKISAISCGINERYNTTFGLSKFDEDGFLITIYDYNDTGLRKHFLIKYKDYEVDGNTLYGFDTEKERIIYHRKNKLKNLNHELYNSLEK